MFYNSYSWRDFHSVHITALFQPWWKYKISIVHRCPQRWRERVTDHNTRNTVPYSLWIACWFFHVPHKCCEKAPIVYCPYLRRLESLILLQMSLRKAVLSSVTYKNPESCSLATVWTHDPPHSNQMLNKLSHELKKWSSHLLDNLSDCLICAPETFQVSSSRLKPMTSAMPVQCSSHSAMKPASQFVGLMCSRKRNESLWWVAKRWIEEMILTLVWQSQQFPHMYTWKISGVF